DPSCDGMAICHHCHAPSRSAPCSVGMPPRCIAMRCFCLTARIRSDRIFGNRNLRDSSKPGLPFLAIRCYGSKLGSPTDVPVHFMKDVATDGFGKYVGNAKAVCFEKRR